MKFISGISQIIEDYDFLILDIWGVIHDGKSLYPDVKETLRYIKSKNKKICLLSNAPRRANKVKQFLEEMLITQDCYDFLLTSGEAVYQHLERNAENLYREFGKKYFYIGPKKDLDLLKSLDYSMVKSADEADFAITTGFDNDSSTIDEKLPQILDAKKYNLPLICANPDLIVVRIDNSEMLCAGVIAKEYEKIGGKVFYFGKPHAKIYETLINNFNKKFAQEIDRKKIIAIGDGLETDIKGANNFSVDSILVLGGILRNQFDNNLLHNHDKNFINDRDKLKLQNICNNQKIYPKFVISTLSI